MEHATAALTATPVDKVEAPEPATERGGGKLRHPARIIARDGLAPRLTAPRGP
jgi:hypothetical protein